MSIVSRLRKWGFYLIHFNFSWHSEAELSVLQREVVIRTRAVLYEKTSKQRNLIRRVKSFRGICYRAKASLGCSWCVCERGKAPPPCTHRPAGRTPSSPHSAFAAYWICQKKMKLSLCQTSALLLVQTQNCRFLPVWRNLHAAVIRQRTKRLLKATKEGSEKLQSRETRTNTVAGADLLWLPSVLLSASQPEGETSARFGSERVLKITDRI